MIARDLPDTPPLDDPVEFASVAGLVYVSDEQPGIRRRRCGRGSCYFHESGKRVQSAATLERIRALVIPPAWTEVWICPLDEGHLQATGRDSQGRKQYLYHAQWMHLRNESKFSRMLAFGAALPDLRQCIERDLCRKELTRDKVLAAVAHLLDTTFLQIGNLEYCQRNSAFGLTTLRDRHVSIEGARIQFEFQGKSGVRRSVNLQNRRLARIVRECRDVPGYRLFQYYDDAGRRRPIESSDVNQYLRDATREDFSAKDFRTWGGIVLALAELSGQELPDNEAALNQQLVAVVVQVAERLGNTRAICRQYYIHPAVFAAHRAGWLQRVCRQVPAENEPTALSAAEQTLLKVIDRHATAANTLPPGGD